jgi:hypothetical protein
LRMLREAAFVDVDTSSLRYLRKPDNS